MATDALMTIVFILGLAAGGGMVAVGYLTQRYRAWLRLHIENSSALSALGEAVGRLHIENSSALSALGEAVGLLRIENSSALSALGEAAGELQKSIGRLNDGMTTIIAEQRNSERTLMLNQHQLARLNFVLGGAGSASDIILGDLDTYDRLDQNWQSFRDTTGKQQSPLTIDGPRDRTAVIIILGQSNAANHGAGCYVAKHRVDNFNLYDGRCYHAADPLLGASGEEGNFATRLGDKLVEAGLFDRVILAPIAMGGTTVEQWADEGMFNRRILALVRRFHDAGLATDFILWHQGEGNSGMGDAHGRQYRKNLLEVVGTFRRYGVNAPFFVALATRCGDDPHPNAVNIRDGQQGAVDPMAGIYLGPDTDTIGIEHRWDKCHFSGTGLDLAASLWLNSISNFQNSMEGKSVGLPIPVLGREEPAPVPARRGESISIPTHRVSPNQGLSSAVVMSQLAAAFAVEARYRPFNRPAVMVDERLTAVTVASSEVASRLVASAPVRGGSPASTRAGMVVAWEGLRHAFHPRAALDRLCDHLTSDGRLIYAQRLTDHYLGLTPKWLLDYFVTAGYADCRVYLLWPPNEAPTVATFDYGWILDNARPVYNPMWDNITHAGAMLVVAERSPDSGPGLPSQDNYRPAEEWDRYAGTLRRMSNSSRPWHVTGPAPTIMPPGCRECDGPGTGLTQAPDNAHCFESIVEGDVVIGQRIADLTRGDLKASSS
jgi:Carbohydrate esterase, sialic acid-specific acetylesterase